LAALLLNQSSSSGRVYGLDILRSIAILTVVIQHGGLLLQKAETNFPWVPLPDGVEIFFVLSGFLIGGILLRLAESGKLYSARDWYAFLRRRWYRTLPNYYLVLLLNILFVYFDITPGNMIHVSWKFFFFLQNMFEPLQGFFWESWSLSIEEWFYILFPLLFMLIFRLFANVLNVKRMLLLSIFLFIAVPFALRLTKGILLDVDYYGWDIHFRKMIPFRLDTIALGILMAWWKFYHPQNWGKGRVLLMLLAIIIYFVSDNNINDINSIYSKVFRFSLNSVCFAALLPFFDGIGNGKGILHRFFTHTSKISYSMYLINLALVAEVLNYKVSINDSQTSIMMYALYWFIVYAVSSLLYKYFEKPVMDLRDR
jgi:peptidoglycan/LPS O-acetylase OafA/YrhL